MNAYYNDNPDIKSVVDGTNPDCNTCIFAFEGLGGNFGGTSVIHPEKSYLKAMMVVTKGKDIKFVTRNASTLPDERPNNYPGEGITTMFEGIYDYKEGYHYGYSALRLNPETDRQGWYKEDLSEEEVKANVADNKFYSNNCKGINIHASGMNPATEDNANSKGCQTVHSYDYVEFGKAVGFLKSECEDEDPSSGITNAFKNHLGVSNEVLLPINVKYILDRTYDKKNSYYYDKLSELEEGSDEYNNYVESYKDYLNGIFYPINHEECHAKCLHCD